MKWGGMSIKTTFVSCQSMQDEGTVFSRIMRFIMTTSQKMKRQRC